MLFVNLSPLEPLMDYHFRSLACPLLRVLGASGSRRSLKPRDRSLKPRDRSLKPRDRSLKPRDRSLKSRDRSLKPRDLTDPRLRGPVQRLIGAARALQRNMREARPHDCCRYAP